VDTAREARGGRIAPSSHLSGTRVEGGTPFGESRGPTRSCWWAATRRLPARHRALVSARTMAACALRVAGRRDDSEVPSCCVRRVSWPSCWRRSCPPLTPGRQRCCRVRTGHAACARLVRDRRAGIVRRERDWLTIAVP